MTKLAFMIFKIYTHGSITSSALFESTYVLVIYFILYNIIQVFHPLFTFSPKSYISCFTMTTVTLFQVFLNLTFSYIMLVRSIIHIKTVIWCFPPQITFNKSLRVRFLYFNNSLYSYWFLFYFHCYFSSLTFPLLPQHVSCEYVLILYKLISLISSKIIFLAFLYCLSFSGNSRFTFSKNFLQISNFLSLSLFVSFLSIFSLLVFQQIFFSNIQRGVSLNLLFPAHISFLWLVVPPTFTLFILYLPFLPYTHHSFSPRLTVLRRSFNFIILMEKKEYYHTDFWECCLN